MFGIGDAICTIDERDVAVVLEIRRRVTVVQTVGIEAEERIEREEQGTAAADAATIARKTHSVLTARLVISVARSGSCHSWK